MERNVETEKVKRQAVQVLINEYIGHKERMTYEEAVDYNNRVFTIKHLIETEMRKRQMGIG